VYQKVPRLDLQTRVYLLDLSLGSIPFKIVPLCSDTSIPALLPLLERMLEVLFSKCTKNVALTSRRLRVMFCLSWSVRANQNTSHDSWPHFYRHVISFQKSPLQICRVSRRIWCLLSAPVSHLCWNHKCEGTHGDKLLCNSQCSHSDTIGMLSGDVPCSQAQRTHSRTAIGWRSMELVSKLFDTLLYNKNNCVQITYFPECKPDTFIIFTF
jgi:hypothetical protein